MADSVNRIVPPSVSVDRTLSPGRERERKKRGESPRRQADEPAQADSQASVGSAPSEQEKGKNLDINV